jgi:hypothetical protein
VLVRLFEATIEPCEDLDVRRLVHLTEDERHIVRDEAEVVEGGPVSLEQRAELVLCVTADPVRADHCLISHDANSYVLANRVNVPGMSLPALFDDFEGDVSS